MKTISLLRYLMMTVVLSLILPSCEQESMLQKHDNPEITDVLTDAKRITHKGVIQLEESDKPLMEIPVTKEMEAAVVEVVLPVKEVVENLLNEDGSGNYNAYKEDIKKLSTLKDDKEKEVFVDQIKEKYFSYFEEIWKKADIDEEAYQMKIKNIFPEEIRETIQFTEFLNFSMHVKKPNSDMNPKPEPPPAPENICFDPQTLWFGVVQTEKSVFSIADAWVGNENVSASALASTAGFGRATGGLISDITIPGTFPDDGKSITVKKTFKWYGNVVAISAIGCSFASISYSSFVNEEFIRLWAPVTWVSVKNFDVAKEEEYVIPKSSIFNIRHGVFSYADSYAGFIAGSTATSHCYRVRWSICEE